MAPANSNPWRSRGPLTLAAASAVLALGTAGCAIDLSDWRPGGGGEASPSPTPIDAAPLVESALDGLAEAPAVQVQGQIADSSGQPRDTTFTVTDTGAASGTVQVDESEAKVMEVDDKLFVSADDSYWLSQSVFNPDSDSYPDHWVRVAPDLLGIDPQAVLTPADLAEILRAQAPEQGEAVEENLDGTPAYRVDLSGGQIWISKDEPHRLLRMQIEELAPADGEGVSTRTALNFTEPAGEDITALYDEMDAFAEDELSSARDSRIEIQWDGELSLDCQTGGACTVSGTAKDVSDGSSSGSIQVRMDATMNNEELGDKECEDSAKLEAGGSADLSCSVDYALEASTSPQSYEISGNGVLSTRAVTGDGVDEVVKSLEEQRETTTQNAEGGAEQSPEAESSPSGN
ncbi:hypothetical protein HDA32_001040 [Spinactinospora alkalitolerans]|uniref:Lipoprotein n=1 Tax=Spinactinospora alkalitolerans TaxID=687207 RepID=A0A852TVK2_9ACTN|nr:hypothetical protein [Spinactinospora alkalitolerans]NYE45920.1 hypothetical protein [Spinactinospora alkalitolerans]